MRKKVYILQDMKHHDYSAVESFGIPVFVGQDDINSRFPIMGTPANRQVIFNMLKVLQQFIEGDYLVIAGNPVMLSLALHYLVACRNLTVVLLKWDNRKMRYDSIEYPGFQFLGACFNANIGKFDDNLG